MAGGIRDSAQATLQRLLATCGELVEKYQQMTVRDPELTYKLETGLRVLSYLFPGGHILEFVGNADFSDRKRVLCPFLGRLGASQGVFEFGKLAENRSGRGMCMQWCSPFVAYCVSNLFSLLNDYIVCKKCPAASNMTKVS